MSNSFICKAPWVSMAFQPEGVAPCCLYELNELETFSSSEEQFKNIKETFLSGQIPSGCNKCSQAFAENRKGPYQGFDRYTTDFKSTSIQEINVKSNNLCNLACRSCGPHFSSKWEEEFSSSIKIIKDTQLFDKLKQLNFSKLKTIKFAGGEPTLTGDHVRILHELIEIGNTDVHITLSTNLHSVTYKNVDLIDLWKQFPNLQIQLSIDAIEEKARAVRSGTNWKLVTTNLQKIIDNQISCYFNITVSALNIWFLEETITWLDTNFKNIKINFFILSHPDILSVHVIPAEYKPDINNMLDRCIVKIPELAPIKQHFNLSSTSELWEHFLIYNLILDATRQETLFNNLPIKKNLIDRWTRL
jgi:uncharacterized Fe-S cluster-containing radical SAM superfamily protein